MLQIQQKKKRKQKCLYQTKKIKKNLQKNLQKNHVDCNGDIINVKINR